VNLEPQRGRDRWRRAILAAFANGGARAVGLLVLLVSVPLTLHHLGPERYGLWMSITGLLAVMTMADLGLGNGLVTALARADGRDDRGTAGRIVSSGVLVVSGIALLLGLVFAACYPAITWTSVYNLQPGLAAEEAGPATATLVGCMLLGLPLGLITKVRLAHQEGFALGLWDTVGQACTLAAVLAAVHGGAGLPTLILAMVGPPVLTNAIHAGWMAWRRPWLLPRLRQLDTATARSLLSTGSLYLVLQLASMAMVAIDPFLAAHRLGPDAVAELSVTQRLTGILPAITGLFWLPLWPAYAEAIARGDAAFVRSAFRRCLGIGLGLALLTTASLWLGGGALVQLWVHDAVEPSSGLILACASWAGFAVVGGTIAMLLNGLDVVRFQVWTNLAMIVIALPLKWLLSAPLGLAGLVWGALIAAALCLVIPWLVVVPRLLDRIGAAR
jgi:O-antigen/teichoic acid export membrane protein